MDNEKLTDVVIMAVEETLSTEELRKIRMGKYKTLTDAILLFEKELQELKENNQSNVRKRGIQGKVEDYEKLIGWLKELKICKENGTIKKKKEEEDVELIDEETKKIIEETKMMEVGLAKHILPNLESRMGEVKKEMKVTEKNREAMIKKGIPITDEARRTLEIYLLKGKALIDFYKKAKELNEE